MRAARYYGIEDIRVEEIDEPVVKDGQVKIKPAFVGICGTGEQFSMSWILPQHLPLPCFAITNTPLPKTSTNILADLLLHQKFRIR
jgi:hypothetical protein